MCLDFRWFVVYAEQTNGIHLIEMAREVVTLECDSCMSGGGAFTDTDYYAIAYPEDFKLEHKDNIAHLEALNLVLAITTLIDSRHRGKTIRINTDNIATMCVLRSGKGHDKILTACARQVWLIAALKDVKLDIIHKSGCDLILADALSRRHASADKREEASTILRALKLNEVKVKIPVDLIARWL
jgi:hypothetical protein